MFFAATIEKKLNVSIGIVLLLLAILGGVAVHFMVDLKRQADAIAALSPLVNKTNEMRDSLGKFIVLNQNYIKLDPEGRFAHGVALSNLDSLIGEIKKLNLPESEKGRLAEIENGVRILDRHTRQIMNYGGQTGGANGGLRESLLKEIEENWVLTVDASEALYFSLLDKRENAILHAEEIQNMGIVCTFGVWFTSLVLAMAYGFMRIHPMLIKPIEILKKAADGYGRGNLDAKIEIASGDEFETLANAFTTMAGRIKYNAESLERGKRELKEKSELVQEIIDNTVDGIVTIDRLGNMQTFNQAAEKIFGYRAEEAIGKNVSLLMPEPYKSEHDGYLNAYLETRVPKIIGSLREVSGLKKDGTEFPLEISVNTVAMENRILFVGVLRDLSPRKQFERRQQQLYRQLEAKNRELKEKSELVQEIIDNTVDGIVTIDRLGNIQTFNRAAENIFGYRAEEAIGKNVSLLMPEPYKSEHDGHLNAYLETRVPKIIGSLREVSGLKKDGTEFPLEISVNTVALENRILFVGVLRDLAPRKQAERRLRILQKRFAATEKLASIGELSAGMCHEILNPVNIISTNVQVLQRKRKEDEDLQTFCDKMRNEVRRIDKIVKSLLVFSRRGAVDVFERVRIDEELESVAAIMGDDLSLNNVQLVRDYASNLPEVEINKDKMRQVFLNLLNNAKHAMSGKTGAITIKTEQTQKDGHDFVRIKFADTGYGIAPENLENIFDPFFTTKPEGEGTGMGLSVVHGIVQEHGGTLSVESELGKGTAFFIDLPAKKDASH